MQDTTCPMVSTIITSYNKGPYLAEAIESALRQDYEAQEILVIDDASTDNTRQVAESYGSQLRYFRLQANRGQSYAKNMGIQMAGGEFIAFLDGDDRWRPGKLRRQVPILVKKPEISVVYSRSIAFAQKQGRTVFRTGRPRALYQGKILDQLLVHNFVSFSSCVVRRRALVEVGLFDESLRVAEDYDLWLRIAQKYPFEYVDEVFVEYRTGIDQIATRQSDQFRFSIGVQRRFIEQHFGGRYPRPAVVRRATAAKYAGHGDYLLANHRQLAAFMAHATSLWWNPFSLKYFSLLRDLIPNRSVASLKSIVGCIR